jgi:sugar/nucleoside kinase (ribokinase family)
MSSPNRAEILRRAKEAFREHGRGFVVVLDERREPHYGFLDEPRSLLADEPDAEGHLSVTDSALSLYRPEEEAVVIDSRAEGIYVLIAGEDRSQTPGEIPWTKPT